ncbi:hypothetical protein KVT40_005858 [Elsinoe batatas]|uniref:Uncharacterized protein n=1 Tax=Elsinoe batatas TaxID=2601811 RepID=A0A8K0L2C5_9PEZI|nr:hypothetical protein KVT40_005858 [Elsinoe batatas]
MASHQSFFSRRQDARQPPLLSTAVANSIQHLDVSRDSPYSPTVLSAPFSPGLPGSPSVPTHSGSQSPMAGRSYQPQQWAGTGPVGGSYMPFSGERRGPPRLTLDATGMESSLPSPPPPYHSPSPTTARTFLSSPGTPSGPLSPNIAVSPDSGRGSTNNSPQLTNQPQFPPPPGGTRTSKLSPRNLLSLSRLTTRNNDNPLQIQTNVPADAPAARRAHSTGAIGLTIASSSRSNVMHSPPQAQAAWQPGMPVPPPPPGPPPLGARSQSSSRLPDRPAALSSLPNRGSAPLTRPDAAPLSPVPPTPADFVDDEDLYFQNNGGATTRSHPSLANQDRNVSLNRRPAHREVSVEAIRDRRSRSRAVREGNLIDVSNQDGDSESSGSGTGSGSSRPANLVLQTSNISLAPRQTHRTTQSQPSSAKQNTPDRHVPRPQQAGMPTPPYTPATNSRNTPATGSRPESAQRNHNRDRAATLDKQQATTPNRSQEDDDNFINASLERFLEFGQHEAAAESDEERLTMFAKFVVDESRIRRERYADSFARVASELYDTTRDMWRQTAVEPPSTAASHVASSRDQSVDSSGLDSRAQSSAAMHSTAPSESELTPATDTESFCSVLERDQGNANHSPWNDRFKPSLSPIPSMTVSTYAGDEADSRGRSASRWWEASDNGSSGTGGRRLERSKQEIKYMSLHPSVMQQALEEQQKSEASTPGDSDSTTKASADEYPPEKVGWHEELPIAGPSRSSSFANGKRPLSGGAPPLPSPYPRPKLPALDVSRLVTLPPPYPRHYPAVNNCHPQLEAPRKLQRALADLSEVRELHNDFTERETALTEELDEARKSRVRGFRAGVQGDIDAGRISHAIAMEADRRFRAHEAEKSATAAFDSYERFQKDLYQPSKTILDDKIQSADESINMMTLALSSSLSSGASERAQVGGDEEPELLEQLTLLKWLFEARETLFKELHDLTLLSARQSRLKEKWSPTYRRLTLPERENDNTRWQKSMQTLQATWAASSSTRFQDLKTTVERHVQRGVEAQVSAFWDVAPQLSEVLSRIPCPDTTSTSSSPPSPATLSNLDDQLRHLPILIPPTELAENEDLHRFPARYLYSTLSHARNSTRQFVDAQINLLCLEHEIATAAMVAGVRAMEAERSLAGEEGEEVGVEMERAREGEEGRLTGQLKERVGEVERGWEEALGGEVERRREVVRGFLGRCGGWEGEGEE